MTAHLPDILLGYAPAQPFDHRRADADQRLPRQREAADERQPARDLEHAFQRHPARIGLEGGEARPIRGTGERRLHARGRLKRQARRDARQQSILEAPPRRARQAPEHASARGLVAAAQAPSTGGRHHGLEVLALGANVGLEPSRQRIEVTRRRRPDRQQAQDPDAVALRAAPGPIVGRQVGHWSVKLIGEVLRRRRRDLLRRLGEPPRQRIVPQLRGQTEPPSRSLALDPRQRIEIEAPSLR